MALKINSEAKNLEMCNSDYHISGLIKKMESFFDNKLLCDVTLIAEMDGIEVKAHRMVLSAGSKYFLTMFTSSLREANATEVPIKEVNGITLNLVINFIYTASIELATDTVVDVLKTAHLFELNSLQEVCCNYITKHLHSSNCIGIALFAKQYKLKTLYDTTKSFVCDNFMKVWHDEEFFQLDSNQLSKFLSSDDLRVRSEEDVFHCMMAWVEYDKPKREQFIDKLLHHIRFPFLNPKFIVSTVELVCNSTESQQLICKACKWHLKADPDHSLSLFADEQTRLRNFEDTIIAIRGLELQISDATVPIGLFNAALEKWVYKECPRLSEARTLFGKTAINGKIIIAGGVLRSGAYTDRVDCLDTKTLKWTQLPPMTAPRSHCGMVTLNGRIYAVGGHTGQQYLSTVETYDPVALQWKFVSSMEFESNSIRVAAGFNLLYVSKTNEGQMFNSAPDIRFVHHVYNPIADTWIKDWFTTSGELLATGTIRILSTNYFIAVSRTNITTYNLETNSSATIPIDDISSEYTDGVVVGDRIIVYGSRKILELNPLRNERKAIPELDNSNMGDVIFITH